MKNQCSENKLVITEEIIFDQNKLSKDLNNHIKTNVKSDFSFFLCLASGNEDRNLINPETKIHIWYRSIFLAYLIRISEI